MPHEGDVFQILTASSFGGTMFGSTSFPTLSGNLVWNITYGAATVALSIVLPGDFNGDGAVDAADYVVWRMGLGTTYSQADYDVWRAQLRPDNRQWCGCLSECRRSRTGNLGYAPCRNAGDVFSPTPGRRASFITQRR